MVVLDQHSRTLGRDLGDPFSEPLVDRYIGIPCVPPGRAETRLECHQNGTALTIWARDYTDREMPAAVVDSADALGMVERVDLEPREIDKLDLHGVPELDAAGDKITTLGPDPYFANLPKDEWPTEPVKEGSEHASLNLLSTELFQSINPFFIVLLTPAVVGAFAWMRRRKLEPSTPGKISLGLRSDYLAIATLGISEIIIAVLKNEDWLNRGVKNVIGLPRPVPYEVDLQQAQWFLDLSARLGMNPVDFSSIYVKLCYALLFAAVLLIVLYLSEKALNSPWGRMMRAIRDNEVSANAMGKDVTRRHLQVFVLGSAVIGIAGAMLTTLDGQFTPASYQPLRFTFLIWVMVIVGGSGNNWGAILGGFAIWFFWIEAEPIGIWLMDSLTAGMAPDNPLRLHLIDSAAHMRLIVMGLILLLVLRFSPRGLIPEHTGRQH